MELTESERAKATLVFVSLTLAIALVVLAVNISLYESARELALNNRAYERAIMKTYDARTCKSLEGINEQIRELNRVHKQDVPELKADHCK